MQRVEVSDAVAVEHDGLAIDDELLMAVLQRRFDNPRIAVGPVVAAAGDQAHAIPLALYAEAMAVVPYFMQPDRMIRDGGRHGGQAGFERAHRCNGGGRKPPDRRSGRGLRIPSAPPPLCSRSMTGTGLIVPHVISPCRATLSLVYL